ncbi:hypothetical protein [Yeosuana marina]|uniref:hypothetical protein n=1 Tax=Yeosuana marina TaxID=1565536 RepID=UPI0030EB3E4A|tara:strand:+ start:322 stop:648 length:327 start_codon:yes stop_codon:yes gene_type:complete
MRNYRNQNQILESKIINLENKRSENLKELKIQFDTSYQELRPSRLLIRTLNDIKEEPKVKSNLFESLISLAGGYLSKQLLVGKSKSIIKNLLGFTLQYFTTKIISKNI